MSHKQPSSREWFERAEQFHYTSLRLLMVEGPRELHNIYSFPHIVLKAFACEAYFKSLIALENKKPPRIHDLEGLFDALEQESRKRIRELWTAECAPKLRTLKTQRDRPKGIKVVTSLRGVLRQSADAFVNFRYNSKGDQSAFTIMSLPTMIRHRILELKPGWKPMFPNLLASLNPEIEVTKAGVLKPTITTDRLNITALGPAYPNEGAED